MEVLSARRSERTLAWGIWMIEFAIWLVPNTDRYINLTQFENTNFSLQLIVHILLLYIYINIFYTHAEWHTERCATRRANKIYLIFNWNKTKNYYNTTIYEYVIIHIICANWMEWTRFGWNFWENYTRYARRTQHMQHGKSPPFTRFRCLTAKSK